MGEKLSLSKQSQCRLYFHTKSPPACCDLHSGRALSVEVVNAHTSITVPHDRSSAILTKEALPTRSHTLSSSITRCCWVLFYDLGSFMGVKEEATQMQLWEFHWLDGNDELEISFPGCPPKLTSTLATGQIHSMKTGQKKGAFGST